VRTPAGAEVVAATASGPRGAAFASFAPKDVTVALQAPYGSARNAWPGRVIGVAPHGDAVRLQVDGPVPLLADITPQALADLSLDEGSPVWCSVKAVEVDLYPA
jgi:molybdate transport system ATP-binding protein